MSTSTFPPAPLPCIAARNFLQWRARTGIAKRYNLRERQAQQTPLASSPERLKLVREDVESDTVVLSNRIAGLLFLLFTRPTPRITELCTAQIEVMPTGINLHRRQPGGPMPKRQRQGRWPLPDRDHHVGCLRMGGASRGAAFPHSGSLSESWCVLRDHQLRWRPALIGGATRVGISMSAVTGT